MSIQVSVSNRIVGASNTDLQLPDIVLDLFNEQMTVSDLITRTVQEQIRDLTILRQWDHIKTQQALVQQYLTAQEIDQQVTEGAIRFPRQKSQSPEIDTDQEVEKALRAFAKGTYLLVIDGYQPENLHEIVTFSMGSKVTFLRLTPLVGG